MTEMEMEIPSLWVPIPGMYGVSSDDRERCSLDHKAHRPQGICNGPKSTHKQPASLARLERFSKKGKRS